MTIKFKGVRIRRDWKGRLEGSVGIDGVFGTANIVSLAAIAVLWITWTIDGVAGKNAMSASLTSHLALFFALIFAVTLATHMGWMK